MGFLVVNRNVALIVRVGLRAIFTVAYVVGNFLGWDNRTWRRYAIAPLILALIPMLVFELVVFFGHTRTMRIAGRMCTWCIAAGTIAWAFVCGITIPKILNTWNNSGSDDTDIPVISLGLVTASVVFLILAEIAELALVKVRTRQEMYIKRQESAGQVEMHATTGDKEIKEESEGSERWAQPREEP